MLRRLPLGKKPARSGSVKLRLNDFIDKSALPKVPRTFGHEQLIGPTSWGMLGNDEYGCCVWSGAAHEHMMWSREGSAKDARFKTANVLSDYSAATGFDPHDPNSDQGTDMQKAADYRLKTGIIDASGKRHKIGAYLALDPGNHHDLFLAVYLFGAVGIGIEVPSSVFDQFNAGKPWDVVPGSTIEGGHYIPFVAKRTNFGVVTWGRLQAMTPRFLAKYNDESVAYVSEEILTKGKSPEGFNRDGLLSAIAALKK
jgi:hypothetical protein